MRLALMICMGLAVSGCSKLQSILPGSDASEAQVETPEAAPGDSQTPPAPAVLAQAGPPVQATVGAPSVGPGPVPTAVPALPLALPGAADALAGGPRRTVAGLGDPGRAGLWLETPLVTQTQPGRVRLSRGGPSAAVTLVPTGGPEGSASRLSVDAMRAIGAPLTALVEIEVRGG